VCVKIGKIHASDLYQELFVILCEKDEAWIVDKYQSGYWEGFIVRIILNQYYGKRTEFSKKHLTIIGEEDVDDIELIDEGYDEKEDKRHRFKARALELTLSRLDWYHNRIWDLYANGDEEKGIKRYSARSINKVTGISRHEILKVIKIVQEKTNKLYNSRYAYRVT
jgi:hypothetical protein